MAKKLYPLRNVPDDEIEGMRIVLRENNIDFHETDAGFFGIGTAAIWVNNEVHFERAQHLIKTFQQARFKQAREHYAEQKSAGQHTRFSDLFLAQPAKVIIYIVIAVVLILLTAGPFWL